MAIKAGAALSVFAGALVVGTAAALALQAAPKIQHVGFDGGDDAAADAAKELVIATLVSGSPAGSDAPDAALPLLLADERPDLTGDGGAGVLGDKAPRQVRFGVVLVTYAGCQGAPPHARPKSEALALALKLADEAKKDFHEAVRHGDPGSLDDAGRIPRGVLEPPVELALWSLAVNTTSDPLDTPRGYWIVRRGE